MVGRVVGEYHLLVGLDDQTNHDRRKCRMNRSIDSVLDDEDEDQEPDVCVHGRGWDETCVDCCPEDVDDYTDYE